MPRRPGRAKYRAREGLGFLRDALYYHTGLAVLALALLGPLFGILRGLGVPYLYWHDRWTTQFVVGLFMGAAYWHGGIVAFVLASAKAGVLDSREPDAKGQPRSDVSTLAYLNLTLVPIGSLLLLSSIVVCALTKTGRPPWWGLPLVVGFACSYAATFGLLALTRKPPRWLESMLGRLVGFVVRVERWVFDHLPQDSLDRERLHRALHQPTKGRKEVMGFAVLFSIVLLIAWLFFGLLTRFDWFERIPAAVPFSLALALFATVYGLLRVVFSRLIGPAVAVAVLFTLSQWVGFPASTAMPNNCSTPECEQAWSRERSLDGEVAGSDRLIGDQLALDAQRAQTPGAPLVIITTSGGGIRSAAWTTAVFSRLEQLDPEFFAHVRLITGASGGMVGASHWVADRATAELESGQPSSGAEVFCRASHSSLYAPFGHLLLMNPWMDRGEALEIAWQRASPAVARPLRELADLEAAGRIPSLVFAPMLIEDGSQMVFSNLNLDWYATRDLGFSSGARQFFARVEGDAVKISTIARLNASFPYVSPGVTLPFEEHPRAVDAGYYDNYGTKLAIAWIVEHAERCLGEPGCFDGPILLLELRDHDPHRRADSGIARAMFHDLTTPPEGLFAARVHVAADRNAEAAARLELRLGSDRFEHIVLQFEDEASLSWELTHADRVELWNAAGECAAWADLEGWWGGYRPLEKPVPLATPACIAD